MESYFLKQLVITKHTIDCQFLCLTKTEKLLSIPKLDNGTGESIANAMSEVLKYWKLEDQVVAMSFDTTNSNTGRYNGACKLIEKKTA